MEVREFAESILFSDSLEAKLRSPGQLTDASPGQPLDSPDIPGRPDSLRFARRQGRFNLPSPRELEGDAARGRLLHFFANHELLATELMALALLKFPDSPKAFRAGLLRTLMDEQAHTRMYLGRLRQLGLEFGAHPVNGFFWRVISDMPTPLDYVSRLSLTFEQANLDYSRLFADRFQTIGDLSSAKLMDRIYHDEINHVGFGLEWFRRWKDSALSDWDAFHSILSLPLSPNRAKAEPFNREGRRAAGLAADFIERLHVYSRSKGKTPQIHCFNPFAEARIGRGTAFEPNQRQTALARDLEILPAFLCRRDDIVLVSQLPETSHLARLKEAGIEPPEFELLRDGQIAPHSDLRTRRLAGFRPWAWCPDTISLLQPLAANAAQPPPDPERWESDHRPLYSKAIAANLLRALLSANPDTNWLCSPGDVGEVATSTREALELIRRWRHAEHGRLVAKLLHGAAGATMLRLWEPDITKPQQAWLERAIAADGGVVLEPWLDRVLDFSFQYDFGGDRFRLLGTPRMINDHRGQYQASEHPTRFTAGMDPELAAILNGPRGGRLKRLQATLGEMLLPRLKNAGFQGAIGIDAFAYRDLDKRLRLKPVVEINPRHTMGRVILELARHAANGSSCRLELISSALLQKTGLETFPKYAAQLGKSHPLRFTGSPRSKIRSGALCLNDPDRVEACLAILQVTETAQ